MDNELNVRAGLNIGIEPSLLPWVQAGAQPKILVKLSGDTVVMEHTDQAARVPFTYGGAFESGSTPAGVVYNDDPALAISSEIGFFFVDELGNEIAVAATNLSSTAPNPIIFALGKTFGFFCLAPGEKIVSRIILFPVP